MAERFIKLFYDWPESTCELTHEEKGCLIDAMIAYARGEAVTLTGNERFVFPVFKAQIDRDRESYDKRVENSRVNGQKGGRPRKNPEAENPENPPGLDRNPENPVGFFETQKRQDKDKDKDEDKDKPPISPKGGRRTRSKKTAEELPEDFVRFWDVYPRKAAKPDALKAWNKLGPDEALVGQIIEAVQRAREGPDWAKDGGQYVPYPASYLNGRRWEDEPPQINPPDEPPLRDYDDDPDWIFK